MLVRCEPAGLRQTRCADNDPAALIAGGATEALEVGGRIHG